MEQKIENKDLIINVEKLKHLKIEECQNEIVVCLIDQEGYQIMKGYGSNVIEAINDLHSNML